MRVLSKYKIYSKLKFPILSFPIKKIQKFKRSKWKPLQRLLIKTAQAEQPLIFKNHTTPFCSTQSWERYQGVLSLMLTSKKSLTSLFFHGVSNKQMKSLIIEKNKNSYTTLLKNILFKPEYRLDILLWRLNFFSSWYNARLNIKTSKILVNNLKCNSVFFLKAGDIITISNLKEVNFHNITNKPMFFNTFVEIDYYTGTIVILKDFNHLTKNDFFMLSRYLYNILFLKSYMLK